MTGAPAPRPLLCDGVVTIDSRARALVVRPAADASATAKLLWRDGVAAQAAAEAAGAMPQRTVWASSAGAWQVSHGLPTDDNALEVRFDGRDAVFRELVSTRGLRARIGFDRASRQIINVTFRGGTAA